MFFKTKICRNKLHIYTEVEVYIAKQDPVELIELGFLVLETSLLLLIEQKYHYKKKRGNQRIEEQPNKSYFEKRKEERERIKRGDVRIVLGASTDNDDN